MPRDVDHTEAHGCLEGADPDFVSDRALDRGADQCGTLGSGNHFLEVQVVDRVFDDEAARAMGISQGQVCVMIHSGSRGLGYQVCDDALHNLRGVPQKYGIELPDRQLVCAGAQPRREEISGGDAGGGEFRLVQSAIVDVASARSVFASVWPLVGKFTNGFDLRRGA